MLGAPRTPSNIEITKVKGRGDLWTWRCMTCDSFQGGQYHSWYSAAAVGGIHRKVHHTG